MRPVFYLPRITRMNTNFLLPQITRINTDKLLFKKSFVFNESRIKN